MGKLTKSQLWDRSQCKICNHPQREDIEKRIFSKQSFEEIAQVYPVLNKQNLSHHWRNHVQRQLTKKVTDALEEEVIKRVNTVEEVTSLFDEWDALYNQLINTLDPQKADYVQKLNAARQLINTKKELCKLNSQLMNTDMDMRNVTDVSDMTTKLKKLLKKRGKDVEILTIEKGATPDAQESP